MKDTEQPDTTDLSKDTFFDFNKYIDTIDYHQDAINKIYVQRHVAFKKSDTEMTVSFVCGLCKTAVSSFDNFSS